MAMKKLQNNFTTPEQSKQLFELGVPKDSADCYTAKNGVGICTIGVLQEKYTSFARRTILYGVRPCWSVGRLMEIIDMCEIDPKDEEYPTTRMIKDKTKMNYIDYLVGTVRMMLPRLDFSKLED